MTSVALKAPTRSQFGRLQDCKTIGDALNHPEMIKRMHDAIPRHINADRMLRVMAQAVHKTPKLAQCNIMSLLGALISLASLGLEPNNALGAAYLIPFEKREKNPDTGRWETSGVDVQVVVGYRGLIDLARRSGSLRNINADVVYEGDEFSFEYGSNQHLRHVPKGAREGRKPLWAYCYVKLTDGEAFGVLPYEEVLKIRDNSESFKTALRAKNSARGSDIPAAYAKAPWVAYEHEMAAKTMIRRVSKMLPLSIEFAMAVDLDEAGDRKNIDFKAVIESDMETVIENLAIEDVTEMPMEEVNPRPKPEPVKEPIRDVAKATIEPRQNYDGDDRNQPEPVKEPAQERAKERRPRAPAPRQEAPPAAESGEKVLEDLRYSLVDATCEEDVDAITTGFLPRIKLLDLADKQEAMRILGNRRDELSA